MNCERFVKASAFFVMASVSLMGVISAEEEKAAAVPKRDGGFTPDQIKHVKMEDSKTITVTEIPRHMINLCLDPVKYQYDAIKWIGPGFGFGQFTGGDNYGTASGPTSAGWTCFKEQTYSSQGQQEDSLMEGKALIRVEGKRRPWEKKDGEWEQFWAEAAVEFLDKGNPGVNISCSKDGFRAKVGEELIFKAEPRDLKDVKGAVWKAQWDEVKQEGQGPFELKRKFDKPGVYNVIVKINAESPQSAGYAVVVE